MLRIYNYFVVYCILLPLTYPIQIRSLEIKNITMLNFKDFSHLDKKKDTKENSHSKTLGTFLQIIYYSEENNSVSDPEPIQYSQLKKMKLKKNVTIEEIEQVQISREGSNFYEIENRLVRILYHTRSEKCKSIYDLETKWF